ncbi:hypothetical protein OX283_003260 [Flavobacterium sp. SUN052]|uniref:hypothetical protein n=1 Tax=Flavobacterium sp. SUN052 TaxID=3002441 RepID=UPI00237E0FCD|nr:hypothetical protein [Flavobacterium sp. SUN052]MEC4003665.1 hypothetical protein [Flavobacterium sp. SUN052]
MSFINCYQYLKKLSPQSLSQLDSETIVRYEKLLKTEVRIDNSKFNTNDVERFLEALRNNSPILQFLPANEELYSLLFERFDFFKNYGIPNFDNYDYSVLKQEISVNLSNEINQFIITRLEQQDFTALKVLLKYKEILPNEVLDLLTYRLEFKLDGYINQMTSIGKLKNEGEYKKVAELVSLFPVEVLVKKEAKVKSLIAQEMLELINHIDKPGIVLFFETMFKGLHYMFYIPNDPYELKIRNRVMGDFKFMLGLLGIVILVIAVGIMYFKKEEPSNQSDFKSNGFYESFSNPLQNNIKFIGNYSDTLKTGFDFISATYINAKSKEVVTIENKTDYDLIVFSDFEIVKEYTKQFRNNNYEGRYFYIKSKESFTFDQVFYPMHFYFGQTLFSTKTPFQHPTNLPRFFHAHANTANLIEKAFELKNSKITFEGDRTLITLHSDKTIFVNGISTTYIKL